MNILALDTSNAYLSVACNVGDRFYSRNQRVDHGHSDELLPLIQVLLLEAGISLSQLDAIAYGQGPGAFTGLRIACGVAQGLALSHELPLLPVITLDAVAFAAGQPQLLVALDARMGEFYCAHYQRGKRVGEISLCTGEALALPDGCEVLVSDAPQMLPQSIECQVLEARPDAESFIRMAHAGLLTAVPPEQAGLVYVRDKVALTAAEQLARKA